MSNLIDQHRQEEGVERTEGAEVAEGTEVMGEENRSVDGAAIVEQSAAYLQEELKRIRALYPAITHPKGWGQ